jgi:hypothetical protein
MTRLAMVFAMDTAHLPKWYAAGIRLFMGWASTGNTAGVNPAQDRLAQLGWRASVKALGPDALYADYPLADWRTPAQSADVALMVNDPQCYGFIAPDEPNASPPADTTGKVWRVTLDQWRTYWGPILTGDPGNTKVRVCDFSGEKLTASWGAYTGVDMLPYLDALTATCSDWHPRTKYGDTRPDCDTYPGRSVKMQAKVAPTKPRWYIAECADEQINTQGRAPTAQEVQNQYNAVMAEDNPSAPITVYGFFPQRPRPGPSHIFDNTTPAQFEAVKSIIKQFVGSATPAPPAAPLAARVADLEKQIGTLTVRLNQAEASAAAANNVWDVVVKARQAATQPGGTK